MRQRSAPQGDPWIWLHAERPGDSEDPALAGEHAVATGECGRVAGQRDESDVAAHGGNRGGRAHLIERQRITIVKAQDIMRGQRRLAYRAGLGAAVRAKVALLHRAHQPAAQGRIGQRRIDQDEQAQRPRGKWPDRQLTRGDGTERCLANLGDGLGCRHHSGTMVGAVGQNDGISLQQRARLRSAAAHKNGRASLRSSAKSSSDRSGALPVVRRSLPCDRRTCAEYRVRSGVL